jgi:hypothetical protein
MTPKEKAEDLIIKYKQIIKAEWDTECGGYDLHGYELDAKLCAITAVNEMIAFVKHAFSYINIELATPSITYLEEVKQEIEKL